MKAEKKKPTVDEYLKEGKIQKDLHDRIQAIPNEDKKARVIETLHRRVATKGTLPSQ